MKRAFDLVITPGGMRRRIIECRSAFYRCSQCTHYFAPERYQRLAKHFHGLMSWATYEHVAHRVSINALNERFDELFGLWVGIHRCSGLGHSSNPALDSSTHFSATVACRLAGTCRIGDSHRGSTPWTVVDE